MSYETRGGARGPIIITSWRSGRMRAVANGIYLSFRSSDGSRSSGGGDSVFLHQAQRWRQCVSTRAN